MVLREITRKFWINADYMDRIEPGRVGAEVSIIELASVRENPEDTEAQNSKTRPWLLSGSRDHKRCVSMGLGLKRL